MIEKKGPPVQGGLETNSTGEMVSKRRRFVNRLKLQAARQGLHGQADAPEVQPSIELYRQGICLHRPVKGVKPANSGGDRDVITGWSSASRRRMREYMLTHSAPQGWATLGPSFTIPGPAVSPDTARKLWSRFCLLVFKAGWGMIWRVEIQARGVLHWHTLTIQEKRHPADIAALWRRCLDDMGPVDHVTQSGTEYKNTLRGSLPGADVHACNISDESGSRGSWLRYMQDHATKAKQEQIPEAIGRHWGVVGRGRFVEVAPILKVDLSEKQYAKVLRCLQRLWTPSRPNPAAPFGRSLSYTPTRGRRGHAVAYTNPITAARLCEWAKCSRETGSPSPTTSPALGKLP